MKDVLNVFLVILFFPTFALSKSSANWRREQKDYVKNLPQLSPKYLKNYGIDLANENNFKEILDEVCITRPMGSKNHDLVRDYIVNYMTSLEWDVDATPMTQETINGTHTFTNVVATLNPNATRRLVLACHYDSIMTPYGIVAATDSAVPCSQIMNLATVMDQQLKNSPNDQVSLQLIFFDGEEAFGDWSATDSLYGARHLAKKWEKECKNGNGTELERIDMFVLLDLIGAKGMKFKHSQDPTLDSFNQLRDIEAKLRDGNHFNSAYESEFFDDPKIYPINGVEDDHKPFMERGVPILHLICVPYPQVWHTLKDTKENIDLESVANLNIIFRAFVAHYLQLE